MNNRLLAVVGVVIIIALFGVFISKSSNGSGSIRKETLKDKVLNRGSIRVGYVVYPPSSIKDPNTGVLSGIFVDALNEAGKNLGLKVEWVEEVGWGSMIEGLRTERYDMIGSPVWSSSPRATKADFTIPLSYSVISVYARANDNRFDKDYNAINSPDVKISIIDGEIGATIAAAQFPNAKTVSLPQLSSIPESLLNVAKGKADIVFVESYFGDEFLKKNPGSIKNVQPANPLRINGNSMVIPVGEYEFKTMLNIALEELLNSGEIDRLIKKYETSKGSFYPIAKPFALPISH